MMAEEKLIREGLVSSVNESLMTARVTFEDRDDAVSTELAILGRGSSSVQDYWLPNVGDTAVCLCAPNGEESGEGWIVGTRYNEQQPPMKAGGRRLIFPSGTTIEMLDEDINVTVAGNLNLTVTGTVSLTSGGVTYVRGSQIRLNDE